MPFFAILLDILTLVAYLIQARSMSPALFMLGTGLQLVVSIILFILIFRYRGQHRARYWTDSYHPFTVGFGIITMSFVVNALVTLLYIFNLLNITHIVFSH